MLIPPFLGDYFFVSPFSKSSLLVHQIRHVKSQRQVHQGCWGTAGLGLPGAPGNDSVAWCKDVRMVVQGALGQACWVVMASWCLQGSQIMVVSPIKVSGIVVRGPGSGLLGSIRLVHPGMLGCNCGATCTCLWPQGVGPWPIPRLCGFSKI